MDLKQSTELHLIPKWCYKSKSVEFCHFQHPLEKAPYWGAHRRTLSARQNPAVTLREHWGHPQRSSGPLQEILCLKNLREGSKIIYCPKSADFGGGYQVKSIWWPPMAFNGLKGHQMDHKQSTELHLIPKWC